VPNQLLLTQCFFEGFGSGDFVGDAVGSLQISPNHFFSVQEVEVRVGCTDVGGGDGGNVAPISVVMVTLVEVMVIVDE